MGMGIGVVCWGGRDAKNRFSFLVEMWDMGCGMWKEVPQYPRLKAEA